MAAPVVLFGAFDRHNFGDLLFAHIASALLSGREQVVAGLADRDLRAFGGHAVQALHRLAREGRLRGADLVHVGGETLTTTARQAAVMLLQPQQVDATLAYLERHPEAEPQWLQWMLGTASAAPYVVSREDVPGLRSVAFVGVGGVALDAMPQLHRESVLKRAASADAIAVRDAVTQSALQHAGITAALMPDPVAMVDTLFGDEVRRRFGSAPVAATVQAFPRGFIAVQLSAEFADDAALDAVAATLRALGAQTRLGIALLRAGAAPWHDPADLPARLLQRLAPGTARVFESLNVWDLCALLAASRASVGSSLHALIVATAFGVPAVGLRKPGEARHTSKLAAYAATWQGDDANVCDLDQLAGAIDDALRRDRTALREHARFTAQAAHAAFIRLAPR